MTDAAPKLRTSATCPDGRHLSGAVIIAALGTLLPDLIGMRARRR